MIGMALVKSLYAIPTWSRTAALVSEHPALQAALGCAPSVYACYRFATKLRVHSDKLDACIGGVLSGLRVSHSELGRDVSIDASDLPAYANGQRFLSKGGPERERYSDPDASWGHRSAVSTRKGGGYYGFKIHAAVDSMTGLPLAWTIETARDAEQTHAPALLDSLHSRGFRPETCAMDSGYDVGLVYEAFEARDCHPIVKLRQTFAVKRGDHKPPICEHGQWHFAGTDYKRKATKWRCPTGECKPASRWVKADRLHPLIPRETLRWGKLYANRSAVERAFGRAKHEWGLLPPRARYRPCPAPRRPHDARPTRLRARTGASRSARGVVRAPYPITR
jgi:hypothetical protein